MFFAFAGMFMVFFMFLHTLFAVAAMFMGRLIFSFFAGMLIGLLLLLHTVFVFVAMLMVVLPFLRFCCYAHGFVDVVAQKLITTDNLNS